MANLDEIALGLATVLQFSSEPEPLGVDVWEQTVDDAVYLVRKVIDECIDAGVPLAAVRIDGTVGTGLRASGFPLPRLYREVRVEIDAGLTGRLEFYRAPVALPPP